MNKHILLFMLSAFFLYFSSCKAKEEPAAGGPKFNMKGMDWILGEWEGKENTTVFYEKWKKISDSTFSGEGFVSRDGNKMLEEDMVLDLNFGIIMYGIDIKGSEQGKVNFRMMEKSDSLWVFSNPEHDYPQNIIYRRLPGDSMTAEISGVFKGRFQKEIFPFKRKSS